MTEILMKTIVVRATWDDEANVWVAEADNLPTGFSLITEADTLDALAAKLPDLIQDLLEIETAPAVEIVVRLNATALA
jgi:hypothetical protein